MALPRAGGPPAHLGSEAEGMSEVATPLFVVPTGGPISSSPLLVDANDDGWPEVFVGGVRFHGLTWRGARMPRWPKKAKRPFASSAAFGDINGDGRGELVIGCDDGGVYAFHVDGTSVEGWPFRTARDVFSTPALADLDNHGGLEVIVGSDDGTVYALNGDGTLAWARGLSGSPFISSSPTVVDLDGDGKPEIAVGAWDQRLHIWTSEGRPYPNVMPEGGGIIWSSATAFPVDGSGAHLTWASDRVHVASRRGESAPGWPNPTRSWMVSSPAVVEFAPKKVSLVVGSDRLYAWDLVGRLLPGWPVDLGEYLWSSPIAFDVDGDGLREVVVGGWDGALHAVRRDGRRLPGFPLQTGGPIFASPAAASLPEGGGLLVVASWDGTIRGWRLPRARFQEPDWPQFRGSPRRTGAFTGSVERWDGSRDPTPIPPGRPQVLGVHIEDWFGGVRRVIIRGSNLALARRLLVHYRIPGEERPHLSPTVRSGDRFVALVQPLRAPQRLRYWVELQRQDGSTQRWPSSGVKHLLQLPSPVDALLRKLKGRVGATEGKQSRRQNA